MRLHLYDVITEASELRWLGPKPQGRSGLALAPCINEGYSDKLVAIPFGMVTTLQIGWCSRDGDKGTDSAATLNITIPFITDQGEVGRAHR